MATLYKPDGTPVEVPDEEVAKRFLAGELGFSVDDHVPVSSPDGKVGTFPGGSPNLKKALEAGWRYDPAALEQKKFGGAGEQAKAFAEGAANVIPGAPAAEAALLENLPEQQRRARIFPGTRTAGELGGIAAATLLAPEAAAPEGAGLARVAVQGALEGGLFGGSSEFNRELLGDEDVSAQKILSTAGQSALFGAGASGALHLAGAVTSGVIGKGTKAFLPGGAQGPRRGVDDAIESITVGAETDPTTFKARLADAFLGKDRRAAAGRLLDKNHRAIAKTAATDAERAAIDTAEGLESMRGDMKGALENVVTKYRGEIDPALATLDPTVPREAGFAYAEKIRERLRFMRHGDGAGAGGPGQFFDAPQIAGIEKQLARLDQVLGIKEETIGWGPTEAQWKSAEGFTGAPTVRATIPIGDLPAPKGGRPIAAFDPSKASPIAIQIRPNGSIVIHDGNNRLAAAIAAGYTEVPAVVVGRSTVPWGLAVPETRRILDDAAEVHTADIFKVLDDTRDSLWDVSRINQVMPAMQHAAAGEARELAVSVRDLLQDPAVFGKAAAAQARKNSLLTRWRDVDSELSRLFGGLEQEISGGTKYQPVNAKKVEGFFGDLGGAAWEPHRKTLAEALLAAREISDELLGDVSLQQRMAGAYGKTAAMAKLGRAMSDLRKIRGISAAGETVLGSVVGRAALSGMMFGPIIGGPGAVAVGTFAPHIGSAVLNLLDQMSRHNTSRIAGLARAIATRAGKPLRDRAALGALAILEQSRYSDAAYKDKPKNARAAFVRRAAELRASLADPVSTEKVLRANVAPVALESPSHAEAMVRQGMKNLAYLSTKLPPEQPRDFLTATAHVVPPSDSDIADFAQAARAIEDPVGVLEDLAHGRMSLAAAETLRDTAPQQFEEMKSQILTAIQETGKPVSYEMRVRLSMFFGTPLDPTIDPTFIAFCQATYAPPAGNPNAPQGTGRTTKDLKSIKNAATEMQGMEASVDIAT